MPTPGRDRRRPRAPKAEPARSGAGPLDVVRLSRPAPGYAGAGRRVPVVWDAGLVGRVSETSPGEPLVVELEGGTALAMTAELEVIERSQLPEFRD